MAEGGKRQVADVQELTLLLFNTHGPNVEGAADLRLRGITNVLTHGIFQTCPNLFVLAQDNITGIKVEEFNNTLAFKNPTDQYDISPEADIFPKIKQHSNWPFERVNLRPTDITDRMKAAILQPPNGIRVLLVSYHGSNAGLAMEQRIQIFRRLITIVKDMMTEHRCDLWIIGGDFNIPLQEARNTQIGNNLIRFVPNEGFDLSPDFVVHLNDDTRIRPYSSIHFPRVLQWRFENFPNTETTEQRTVLLNTLRRSNDVLPFDHPRLLYKFYIG